MVDQHLILQCYRNLYKKYIMIDCRYTQCDVAKNLRYGLRLCDVRAHSMVQQTYYSFKNNSIENHLCCGSMLIVHDMHMHFCKLQ